MQGGALGNDKSGVMSEVSRQLAQSQSGESEQSGRSRVTRFGGVAIAGDGDRQPQSSSRFNVVGDFAIDISRADRYREYAKGAPETPPPAPSVALGYSAAPTAPGQRGVEAGRPAVTAPGIDSSLGDSLAADAPAAESLGTVPMDLFSTRGFAPSPQMSDGVMRSAQGLIEDAITPGIVLGESEERFEGFDNKIAGVNNSNDHPFSDPNSKSDWGIAAGGESNGQADKNSNAWMYSDRDVRAKDKLQIAGSAGEKPLNRNQLWSEFDVAENSGLIPATPNSEPSIVAGRAPAANSIHDRRLPGDLSDESLPSLETERLSELAESQSTKSEQAEVALGLELPAGQPLVGSGLDVTLNKKLAEVPMLATPAQAEVQELNATDNAFSTFSLHVSDVSFQLAKSELENNAWPNPQQVRVEEFVNAFGYHDPLPRASERVACRIDQAIHPSMQQRNVLRLSMRTAAFGRAASTPLQLTVLLDHSGSMERSDRQQTLRAAFETLAQQLTPNDHVTLISFARQPRLVVDQLPGGQSEQLLEVLDQTPVQGGTNFEAAIELASQKASEHFDPNAQNRIVLMTDGAVNLGDADPLRLSNTIETLRDRGIAFDAAGIGADGLNDEVLESLTRKGDGRYYLLNSVAEADEAFAKQIAGSLRPFAKNVKVQVEFNPERVGQYKLLGFDEHRLNKEDFHNDAVDAAELTAEEAGVAVYQVEVKPNGSGDVGSVSVRFQDVATGRMVERRWPIPFDPMPSRLESADPAIKLATVAALFASKLKADPIGTTIDFATLKSYLNDLPSTFAAQPRVTQLQDMIGKAQQLTGN
ncbi:hypothetical protein C2E31_08500 [Rhodopirellula baltica]|nr:hypothetical protein C2E31_08500 [Rhodopirellula baltica]